VKKNKLIFTLVLISAMGSITFATEFNFDNSLNLNINKTDKKSVNILYDDWTDVPTPEPPPVPDPVCDEDSGTCHHGDYDNNGEHNDNNGDYNDNSGYNDDNNGWSHHIHVPTGDEDPFPLYDYWPGAVCTGPDVLNEKCYYEKGEKTIKKLKEEIIKKIVSDTAEEVTKELLKILFHPSLEEQKLYEALIKLNIKTLEAVDEQLKSDLKNIRPYFWESKERKEYKLMVIKHDEAVLNTWIEQAKKEAMSHYNWVYDNQDGTYNFTLSPAYIQLQKALIGKEFFR